LTDERDAALAQAEKAKADLILHKTRREDLQRWALKADAAIAEAAALRRAIGSDTCIEDMHAIGTCPGCVLDDPSPAVARTLAIVSVWDSHLRKPCACACEDCDAVRALDKDEQ
jgi:hypothetical protein